MCITLAIIQPLSGGHLLSCLVLADNVQHVVMLLYKGNKGRHSGGGVPAGCLSLFA